MAKPLWWEMWVEGWTTSVRLAETMAAAQTVVSARVPMIRAAAHNPLSGNWSELNKMVAEKVEAFTLAGLSLAHDAQAIQAEMLLLPRSVKAAAALSGRIGQRVAGVSGRALAPVHATATRNARRLR